MTGYEFVEKLKQALENDLSADSVREQTAYYRDYIRREVERGRTEEEVTEELGDPWAIARNIISAEELQREESGGYQYEPEPEGRRRRSGGEHRVHVYGIRRWQVLLLVLGMIGILALVLAVIGGIFALLAPVLAPLVVLIIIIRIFGRRQ